MRVGIVGSEQAKFTPETKRKARDIIDRIIASPGVSAVVSGGCHLGGVDIFAEEQTAAFNTFAEPGDRREFVAHLPRTLSWQHYKARNLAIVRDSDEVHCITVAELPASYAGMRFGCCYHCARAGAGFATRPHVKSGGCWTMHQARKQGKKGVLWIV